ncbi:patatin-like phospholipase family protein [Methylocystis sp.]|uniref:patatin-like phospholipase family protein n=1 Tax=Methylocystis sp. TaxID=1911079 RepID=UPI003DA5AF38
MISARFFSFGKQSHLQKLPTPDKPFSIEDVVRAELFRLRPKCPEARQLPKKHGEGESSTDRVKLERELFQQKLTALCLSGGGIRSASLCLGVLEALAARKLLSEFDYLSTVSGGGYIGSWLSAWRKRINDQREAGKRFIEESKRKVAEAKTRAASDTMLLAFSHAGAYIDSIKDSDSIAAVVSSAFGGDHSIEKVEESLADSVNCKFRGDVGGSSSVPGTEAPEVKELRSYTSYLTPRTGVMSLDSWAWVATIIRNLVLNWMLFLPMFLLLVAAPKLLVLLFEWLISASDHQEMAFGIFSLLGVAIYAISEFFTSRELLIISWQDEIRPKREKKQTDYGAPAKSIAIFGLLLPGLAAFFACIALKLSIVSANNASVSLGLHDEQIIWLVAIIFVGGAALWGGPFLLASLWTLPFFHRAKLKTGSRDEFCNWLALAVPRFMAGGGVAAALAAVFAMLRHLGNSWDDRYFLVFGIAAFYLAHLAGAILFAGATSNPFDKIDRDAVREWTTRVGGLVVMGALVWAIYATLVLWDSSQDLPKVAPILQSDAWWAQAFKEGVTWVGGPAGLAAAFFGFSSQTPNGKNAASNNLSGLNLTRVAVAGALCFFAFLIYQCSQLFDRLVLPGVLAEIVVCPSLSAEALVRTCVATVALMMWIGFASLFINVNRFSLHAYYRNRLIRSYFGASNYFCRRPNAFTDYDASDNVKMRELSKRKPLHIVNMALNLADDRNLAWQERKASSFTATPDVTGNPDLGYRRSKEYGSEITLGTAMAISGAAVSSNMGYHSSPPLAFLMTLFNVRLGWWLGNPRDATAWQQPGPKGALYYFLLELFGLTNDRTPFVYLSDGGHFENLGVYEMLRRRCRTIVAVDAGADPQMQFEDLGNLVRKARIDLGVEIVFSQQHSSSPSRGITRLGLVNRPQTPTPARYCILATIRYPGIEETGTLIYIKAAIHGDEPEDISSYATVHSEFPHETTADQFFNESQFESYRRLGLWIGAAVFGGQAQADSHALNLEKRAAAHAA